MNTNTKYDEIFKCFLDNCGVEPDTLPRSDEGKYAIIKSGSMHYNLKVDSNITKIMCDDAKEEINLKLEDIELLLLTYCMKYSHLENELVEFEQKYQMFQKDIGTKFYGHQIKARQATIDRTEAKIAEILSNLDTHCIME